MLAKNLGPGTVTFLRPRWLSSTFVPNVVAVADDPTSLLSAPHSGLAALFDSHRRELARFLAARCGDPDQAEDLMQELWLKLAGANPGPIANGRAYLFRMANNLMLDQLRAKRRAMARDHAWLGDPGGASESELRPDPAPAADVVLAQSQEAALLARAIDALPPGAARALRLHRIEELDQGEVARRMGISRSGVEKHLATAMRHLRNSLHDCGWYGPAASGIDDRKNREEISPENSP